VSAISADAESEAFFHPSKLEMSPPIQENKGGAVATHRSNSDLRLTDQPIWSAQPINSKLTHPFWTTVSNSCVALDYSEYSFLDLNE